MKNSFILGALCIGMSLTAQTNDPVVMSIGSNYVTKSEFEYIYNKNNQQQIDNKSFDEYITLFENFKLKVAEAEAQGLHLTDTFIKELSGYRSQLAEPYLVDQEMDEQLAREAYARLTENIETSHILLRVPQGCTDAQEEEIVKKANSIADRIRKGESFETLARQYSEDPSVADNGGYLGFLSGFMTVYPFESAAYNTPVGQISDPVKSQFGYHIVKVSSRRPDIGQVQVAHIMKMIAPNSTAEVQEKAEKEIRELYQEVIQGGDFATIAREKSDDKQAAQRGGELPLFGTGRMVKEFETAAFALQNKGDISQPIRSPFGWHIIKLLDKKPLASYEEKKSEIAKRISRDERSHKGKESLINKLKKEYNVLTQPIEINALRTLASTTSPVDSAYFAQIASSNAPLLICGEKTYTVGDFAVYLKQAVNNQTETDPVKMLNNIYNDFTDNSILAYEETQLENKYPEFKHLMKEYRDGILLFEVMNNEVWEKASNDEKGLKDYFKKNKKKYAWTDPRFKGFVLHCYSQEVADKALKMVKKLPVDSVSQVLTRTFNNDSIKAIKIEKGMYTQGDNKWVDARIFKTKEPETNEKYPVVVTSGKVLKKMPESYEDVRGLITADYQNILEEKWITSLRAKYPIATNREILNSLAK